MKTTIKNSLISAIIGLTSICATAATVELSGDLSGSHEVPPNASGAKGMAKATLDTATNELSWTVTYSGLSGAPTAGHIHGPAAAGTNGGVAVGFKGALDSPISGKAVLTAEQAQQAMDGKYYVNLHTKEVPGGEARAQLTPAK
jgi:hypothetical protein